MTVPWGLQRRQAGGLQVPDFVPSSLSRFHVFEHFIQTPESNHRFHLAGPLSQRCFQILSWLGGGAEGGKPPLPRPARLAGALKEQQLGAQRRPRGGAAVIRAPPSKRELGTPHSPVSANRGGLPAPGISGEGLVLPVVSVCLHLPRSQPSHDRMGFLWLLLKIDFLRCSLT